MSGMPPLQLSVATSSRSGDINAPNTVNFGGFGPGAGGGGLLDGIGQYWWVAAVVLAVYMVKRRKP